MEDYKSGDKIVTLKCDDKHYFHDHCIEEYIEKGNFKCPLCQALIETGAMEDNKEGGMDEPKGKDAAEE